MGDIADGAGFEKFSKAVHAADYRNPQLTSYPSTPLPLYSLF